MSEIFFKAVEFENFGVFRDFTRYEFNHKGIVQVIGLNEFFAKEQNALEDEEKIAESRSGSGKSYFCHSVFYALYGDNVRKKLNKDKIVNKESKKNLYVGLEFIVDGNEYRIERYRKHSKYKNALILKKFENDEWKDISHADIDQTQLLIEKLIGIDSVLFKLSHLLAHDGSPSFFAMNYADRIKIFESLIAGLDLEQKIKLLKKEQTRLNKELTQGQIDISAKKESINSLTNVVKNQIARWRKLKKDLGREVVVLDSEYAKASDMLGGGDVQGKIEHFETQFRSYVELERERGRIAERSKVTSKEAYSLFKDLGKKRKQLKRFQTTLSSTLDDNCPHCNKPITSREQHREEVRMEIEETKKEIEKIKNETLIDKIAIAKIEKEKLKIIKNKTIEIPKELPEEMRKEIGKAILNNVKIPNYMEKLNDINGRREKKIDEMKIIYPKHSVHDTIVMIRRVKKELETLESTFRGLKELKSKNDFWLQAYTTDENSVKQFAIGTMIPHFNKLFRDIIDIVFQGSLFSTFNSALEESFSFNGQEYEFEEFSTGEKRRINLCVYLSLLILTRLNITTSNVLFLDEIFSSTDPMSIRFFVSILERNFPNSSIFIVSHDNKIDEILEKSPKIVIKKIEKFSSKIETFF